MKDDLEDCVLAVEDVARLSGTILKRLDAIRSAAIEIERQLSLTDADFQDPYDPITRSIRLIEEILDATD